MELQLFLNKNLALHFYYHPNDFKNNKVKVKDIYLLIPGLPQFIHKSFFGNRLREGRAFFYVYYYGSWFSGGRFTFRNCQKTVTEAIKFVQGKIGIKTYDKKNIKWEYQNLFLVGNSFGGSPILSSKIDKKDIKKIILISPLSFFFKKDLLKVCSNSSFKKIIKRYKETLFFLRNGNFNIFRGIKDKSWDKYFLGKEEKAKIKIDGKSPPIIIFHGNKDGVVESFFSEELQKMHPEIVQSKIISGIGHNFEELFDKFDKEKINGKN